MPRLTNHQQSFVTFAIFSLLLTCLFWPGVAYSEVPAFRDAYHFYYPQAVWLHDQAQAGHLFPQWNALSGLGISVPGQISSALYYPLRWIWLLPGFSVAQAYSCFIICHLLIAALGVRLAARRLGQHHLAADMAGISYALSCPVFFQHNNLIYLTSAAWIGFALSALIEAARSRKQAHLVASTPRPWSTTSTVTVFTASSSLMLLGGDPHTLANAWILSALSIPLLIWMRRSLEPGKRVAALLAISILLTTLLTSIQWIPALRWAAHSERATNSMLSQAERSSLRETLSPDHAAVFEFAQMDTRSDLPYDFSVPPWYLATVAWAQAGGHYLPENSRSFSAIPAEGRMWQPSLYFGLLPFLLLASPANWRRITNQRVRLILAGLALFGLLACFGNYSITWFSRQLLGFPQIPDHTFSLYGLLTLIPGYAAFRFPGKWAVWFVAGACLLASSLMQKDDQTSQSPQAAGLQHFSRRACLLVAGASLGLLLFSFVPQVADLQIRFAQDGWLGQATWPQVLQTIRVSAIAPTLICFALLWRPKLSPTVVLALTLCEMTWAASSWVCFVAAPTPVELRGSLPASARVWTSPAGGRFSVDTVVSPEATGSLAESEARYQDRFLLAKLGEIPRVSNLGSIASVEPLLVARLKFWLNARRDKMHGQAPELERTLEALGVTHRLVRTPGVREAEALQWKALDAPRPFCECVVDGVPASIAESKLKWSWASPNTLQIDIQGTPRSNNAVALIRQVNDGGWQALGMTAEGEEVILTTNFAGVLTPFTEVPVGGLTRVVLRRQPGW